MGKLQKLDNRIQTILQNGIQSKHRTVFIMVGNKGQDQVPIMHQILNSLFNKGRLSLLWCYKKELSFSTHRKKNLKLLNKKRKAGVTSDATIFEQFICTTDIRWCYYHETDKILGQTFDMCILQDFEALTPNTLARTIETVSGGGLIVFLLKSMDSLRQLCTMAMDVHSRYRTEAHQDVVCRFNERFLLSLTSNSRCLVLDDRWQVLPLSKKVLAGLQAGRQATNSVSLTAEQQELQKLKVSLAEDGSPFAPLVKLCVTLDQARGLVQFCASVASTSQATSVQTQTVTNNKSVARCLLNAVGSAQAQVEAASAIVIVTASRGRGKSAALGLGLAAAIEAGLPNLYVTAPSPENLTTLMQFVVRGLTAFGYEEHQDYAVTKSTDPDYNHAIIRIDVHRQNHRQSLVYLSPWELASQMVGIGSQQADLVCIDEAAAIPLTLVRLIITGPRLAFMASTVNGYEGTGRSLSLKLIKQLRTECRLSDTTIRLQPKPVLPGTVPNPRVTQPSGNKEAMPVSLGKSFRTADTSRVLYEVTLNEAIRYANGDPVEAWLNELLCLDCGSSLMSDVGSNSDAYYPPVDQCQLYYVNRDTLFAYHKSTEIFLHRLMALYVASHYKNSPNDLQLLSDAPAHHIFCLLAPYNPESGKVPEILCVLQVCLEGLINKDRVMRSLSRGLRPSGDLIPWTISQQFCDPSFGSLSGARVVRIATHPEYQNLGYGTRALNLLHDYYSGKVKLQVPNTSDELDKSSTNKNSSSVEREEAMLVDNDEEEDEEEEEQIDQINSDEDAEDLGEYDGANAKAPGSRLLTESIERRGPSNLPPLLSRLNERAPEPLDYIGVSFGATPSLLRFWKRSGYIPVYLRQTLNELTGEFTCIMLKQFNGSSVFSQTENWLCKYHQDFVHRFVSLLPGCFRYMDAAYALELVHNKATRYLAGQELTPDQAQSVFTRIDMERLHNYTRSLVDFHVVSDLLPRLAHLYFNRRLPEVKLNKTQQVILLGLGLQHKTVERLAAEFGRLLGDSAKTRTTDCSRSADTDVVLAQAEENKMDSTSGLTATAHRAAHDLDVQDKTPDSGWTKRIRGLLFVLVRELVRSLDSIVGSSSETDHSANPTTQLVAASVGGSLTMTLDESGQELEENGDASEGDDETVDEDDADEEVSSLNQSTLNDAEINRRASLVRQLMSEELTSGGGGGLGSLERYKVHGSENDWAQAIVGHGSDLSTLNVKLPLTQKSSDDQPKKKRHKPGAGIVKHVPSGKKKKLVKQ
ncbi:N-acetyltransferase 10 [Clonorchis sinensis]|uniref:RNA cytidine acetyltransferase n=1 Tax=Clonorchis sinensis TaxID=79923 RepID=A0A8T1MER5_CLOSI|nr:N-acetyltransferase 10 [Clonorchis sinensis]